MAGRARAKEKEEKGIKLLMTKTMEWHQAPQEERTLLLRILILKTMLEELHNRTLKLQSTDSSDLLIQTLVKLRFLQLGEDQKEPYLFPRMKWDHNKNEVQALTEAQVSLSLATDVDSPAERSSDQEISCPTSQPEDSEAHQHGLRKSFSGHSMESDTGPDPHLLERIERALAPTQHGPLATDPGKNAPSNDAEVTTGTTPRINYLL